MKLGDLNPYGDSDTLGMWTLLLKRTDDVLVPRLSIVLRCLLRLGSFPTCWRQANVTHSPPLMTNIDRFS